jgi:hypothetical protein
MAKLIAALATGQGWKLADKSSYAPGAERATLRGKR